MKKSSLSKFYSIPSLPLGLLALAAQLHAVTFDNAGGDNYWGNDANWQGGSFPNGVDTTASIYRYWQKADQLLLLADSSGNDQSYTVRGFTFSSGSGGGAGSDHYRLRNVTGGTASLVFQGSVDPAFLKFSNNYASGIMEVDASLILNSDLNVNVDRTIGISRIDGVISGANGVDVVGRGTLILNGSNTYTGSTTLSNGTLLLGAAERIADSSSIIFNGGALATNGLSETMGTIQLSDDSTLDLGSGVSALSFLDSSSLSWSGSAVLTISNFDEGLDSIRFGTDASGLSGSQLSQIVLNGGAASLDGSGYLTAVPEAGSFALLSGFVSLGLVALRRRR